MTNAVVTGTVDLVSLEALSTNPALQHKFVTKLAGNMLLNGVRVSLHSDSSDTLVKTVNRFTTQSLVVASVGASTTAKSTDAKAKYFILTCPEDMRLDGDDHVLGTLGLISGTTRASTTTISTGI
jgi:hypothetical protein